MSTANDTQPKVTPIIKIVGDFCNLRCKYCFYSCNDQSTPHRMSDVLLEQFLREYLELFDGNCTFIWHGGEPMLAGLRFFEMVISLQRQYTNSQHDLIKNTIQTNATLIDKRWAQFFKEHNFRIGVSIDGDRQSHDRFRVRQDGKSSFDMTMQGISYLRDHDIPFGVIQTLPRSNLGRVNEDFRFFVDALKLDGWGINAFCDFRDTPFARQETITNQEYASYMKRCFDFWLMEDSANLRIREIDSFLAGLFCKRPASCMFNGNCARYISVNWDGKVYPCERFSGQQKFCFGDLSKMSLGKVLTCKKRTQYALTTKQLPIACQMCDWQMKCNNGCTHHRIGAINGIYHYCVARKEIFSYLHNRVKNIMGANEGGEKECPSRRG